MLCIECYRQSASLIHLSGGGRLCPKCYHFLMDADYQSLSEEVREWETQFLQQYDYVTDEDQLYDEEDDEECG